MHGDKHLEEKLGRNDPCPCGSGNRFQELLLGIRAVRRRGPEPLRPLESGFVRSEQSRQSVGESTAPIGQVGVLGQFGRGHAGQDGFVHSTIADAIQLLDGHNFEHGIEFHGGGRLPLHEALFVAFEGSEKVGCVVFRHPAQCAASLLDVEVTDYI